MLNSGESELVMTRDSEVEVCSEEEGFEGAWFRAVLEENTMKKARKKIRVRYLTLLSEDRLSCLVESVEQKFIRPVPKEEEYGSVVIEEGVVVDAYFKDGWWRGVVVKEMGNEEFLVLFDVPPDVIKFKKMQLRAHVDWNGWKWNVPDKKVLDKSVLSPGTMVEVRSVIGKAEEAWVLGMVVTETEEDGKKKFLIKDWKIYISSNGEESRPNIAVDAHLVRPIPPPSSVETFKLLESVEAFRNSKWCKGLVIGVLSDDKYMISFEGTKEESVFKHASVRPLRVWENGVWRDGPKGNPIEESPSRILRRKAVSSSSSAKPVTSTNSVRLTRRSLNLEGSGETFQKCETVAATGGLSKKSVDPLDKTSSIATEAVSPVTPVVTAPLVKPTETETEGKRSEPARNQNGCGNDSTQQSQNGSNNNSTQQKVPEEEKSKDASRKRKRNEQDDADLSESDGTSNGSKAKTKGVDDQPLTPWMRNLSNELSSTQSPSVVLNSVAATNVPESQAKDTLTALPFQKNSPYWKSGELQERIKISPQRPHFSPLLEQSKDEDIREWTAVGMMVTFYRLLDEVKALKLDDPSKKLYKLSDHFAKMEKYGFDISTPQALINKVLSLQDVVAEKSEERKYLDNKIEEEKSEKRKLEEKRAEVKRKILELKKEEAIAEEMENAAATRIVDMEATVSTIKQKIKDVEVEFEKSISQPW